jgi:hypothetical protein
LGSGAAPGRARDPAVVVRPKIKLRRPLALSASQLRIVAVAADLLPVEARGTFLRRVVAELRVGRDFSDIDVEQAVHAALLDQSADGQLV